MSSDPIVLQSRSPFVCLSPCPTGTGCLKVVKQPTGATPHCAHSLTGVVAGDHGQVCCEEGAHYSGGRSPRSQPHSLTGHRSRSDDDDCHAASDYFLLVLVVGGGGGFGCVGHLASPPLLLLSPSPSPSPSLSLLATVTVVTTYLARPPRRSVGRSPSAIYNSQLTYVRSLLLRLLRPSGVHAVCGTRTRAATAAAWLTPPPQPPPPPPPPLLLLSRQADERRPRWRKEEGRGEGEVVFGGGGVGGRGGNLSGSVQEKSPPLRRSLSRARSPCFPRFTCLLMPPRKSKALQLGHSLAD